ncbi:hypothetical protein NC653_030171 [Populus alba x Populus x berolinensis]|uniref:Uncharacterized protein n=1 Tax=Populus alba x Populus x berolinensis TaxID=444605 RepID=A0AAD6Q048_9ROSI|nr:hypothetical protein NC653_030171 [Populus alba x Populus x berolinensis]
MGGDVLSSGPELSSYLDSTFKMAVEHLSSVKESELEIGPDRNMDLKILVQDCDECDSLIRVTVDLSCQLAVSESALKQMTYSVMRKGLSIFKGIWILARPLYVWVQHLDKPRVAGSNSSLDPCIFGLDAWSILKVAKPKIVGSSNSLDPYMFGFNTWLSLELLVLVARSTPICLPKPKTVGEESSSPHKISYSPAITMKSHENVRLPQILKDDTLIMLGAEDIEFVTCLQPRKYTT